MKKEKKLYDLIAEVLAKKSDEELQLLVFTKLNRVGFKVINDVISQKFMNVPFSFEEMYSYVYFIYLDTIRWCQMHNCSVQHFYNLFMHKLHYCTINVCIKYTRNGHAILNQKWKTDITEDQASDSRSIENSLIWNDVANMITNKQRTVLLLKLKGYSNCEISNILKCEVNYVRSQIKQIKNNPEIRKLFNKEL